MNSTKIVIVVLIVIALSFMGTVGLGLKNDSSKIPQGDEINKDSAETFHEEHPSPRFEALSGLLAVFCPRLKLERGPLRTNVDIPIDESSSPFRIAKLHLQSGTRAVIYYTAEKDSDIPALNDLNKQKLELSLDAGTSSAASVLPFRMAKAVSPGQEGGRARVVQPPPMRRFNTVQPTSQKSSDKSRGTLLVLGSGGKLEVVCLGCEVVLE